MKTARLSQRAAALALIGFALLFGGCASGELMLYNVGSADPKQPREFVTATAEGAQRGLRVTRSGQPLAVRVPMPLAVGDRIETLPGTLAVIRFADGHEATLLPETRVTLGSLFADFGAFFVRVFKQAQGVSFKVKTEYVTAGVEGTEFWVRLDHDAGLSLGVVEGRVSLASTRGRWEPVAVTANEVATVSRDGPPSKALQQQSTVDAIVQLMRNGIHLAPPVPPMMPPQPVKR